MVNEISREIWFCLKCGWDIGRKLKIMLSDFIFVLIYGGKMGKIVFILRWDMFK